MINRDWERFGEEIRRTVQNAIDSQDFGKLNQTITNTINDAVDGITNNIRNTQAAHPYREEKKLPKLFRKVTSVKATGVLMTVMGAAAGGVGSLLFLLTLLFSVIAGIGSVPEIIMMALFLILAVSGFILCGCGTGLRGRVRRFQAYVRILGQREYCNVRELADQSKKSVKYVVKDLEYMLSKRWFLQGHLDERKTCLIVSHGMYEQYLQIEANRKQNELEELRQDTKGTKEKEAFYSGKTRQDEAGQEIGGQRKPEAEGTDLPPKVRKVIREGDAYIRKIHACNDAIPGGEISAKISRMEMLIDKIFDRVKQDPDSIDDIRKLMEYYLPTTVKLLEAYQELASQPVDGENIRSSKREIEETLDTLNAAFEKLLDGMFQETAWDVSSDISVLHTLLAQEGLMDDGLKKSNYGG